MTTAAVVATWAQAVRAWCAGDSCGARDSWSGRGDHAKWVREVRTVEVAWRQGTGPTGGPYLSASKERGGRRRHGRPWTRADPAKGGHPLEGLGQKRPICKRGGRKEF